MTIEELETAAPQAQGPTGGASTHPSDDLEALVRTLADRANAADQRSAALAERVALLEDTRGGSDDVQPTADEAVARPGLLNANGRFGSTRKAVSFARRNGEDAPQDASTHSARNTDASDDNLQSVVGIAEDDMEGRRRDFYEPKLGVGIPQDDVEEALSDRVLLLERRLEDYEEEKGANMLDERRYCLPESTFSLLITHHPLSIPFAFAVFSVTLSISCLCLTLASSIQKGTAGNQLGIPAGVNPEVRAAQFIGAIVGVLMEDEIPQGLQLIANGAGHTLLLNGKKPVQKRVIVSSIFRLIVGYLFLSSLFMNIAQNNDVIEIFYDVLALEFVENIDDTTYALAKKGFFGKHMLVATNQNYNLELAGMRRRSLMLGSTASITERRLSFSGLIASNTRVNHIVRIVYFLNCAIILAGLAFVAVTQNNGHYRCNSLNVLFDEEIWESSIVRLPDGSTEERLLIYPYFNGIYKEDGSFNGYPRYVEQNKNNGNQFGPAVTGAELIYCGELGSWVFMHPDISTSTIGGEENECSWLWKSYQTQDYDILSTNGGTWEAWIGEVKPLAHVSITCNECSERSDCNYHGECMEGICSCDDTHFGDSCEFEVPCDYLASEKAQQLVPGRGIQWDQDIPITLWGNDGAELHTVYNRPVYIQKGLTGEPFDMRLYKILEKEVSTSPSGPPSSSPSLSKEPTFKPTPFPTFSPVTEPPTMPPFSAKITPPPVPGLPSLTAATPAPSMGSTPGVGTNTTQPPAGPEIWEDDDAVFEQTAPEPPGGTGAPAPTPPPTTPLPTKPLHSQNEYDTAPDFADWDDFFESPSLHDLEDILEDFSVAISYSGSRFYGTIIDPNATIDDLYPSDFHAFWSQSFDVNRTFIISDTTVAGSPVGIDFFEMRRRVKSLLNEQVQFSYGPFGALIPMMDYEDTGFFHCLDVTGQPSSSPSISGAPTATASPSQTPTDECFFVDVNILHDCCPSEISWTISNVVEKNQSGGEPMVLLDSSAFKEAESYSLQTIRKCLPRGSYEFIIRDSFGDGIISPGYYNVTTDGEVIVRGGGSDGFQYNETTAFSIPYTQANI